MKNKSRVAICSNIGLPQASAVAELAEGDLQILLHMQCLNS